MDRMNHGRHRAGGAKRAVQKPETAASQTTLPNRPAVTSLRRSHSDRAEESNRAGPCRPPFSGLLRCPRRSRRKSTVAGRRASQSGVVDGLSEFGTEQDRCRGSIRTEWVFSRESRLSAPVAHLAGRAGRGSNERGRLTIFWPRSRLNWVISSWHSTRWSCKNRSSGNTLPQMTCPAGSLLSFACGRPIANSSVGGGATHTCAWYVRWCASRDAKVG